jgi:hypothetical protein
MMRTMLLLLVAGSMAMAADVPVIRCTSAKDTQITLYLGNDRALVQETNSVYLPAGRSEMRFRWADPDIDEASVSLTGPAGVTIGGLRQLPDEAKTFIWPVDAIEAGPRDFVASYFLRGLKWSVSYTLNLDATGTKASLRGMLHLTNDSRMALRGVSVRLCSAPVAVLEKGVVEGPAPLGVYAKLDNLTLEPGWQKRVPFVTVNDAPARIIYRADNEVAKSDVQRFLYADLRATQAPGPLPVGHLEVREVVDGRRVPVLGTDLNHNAGGETAILLGTTRDIVFVRTPLGTQKTNVEFDRIGRVSGFDTSEEVGEVLRNRMAVPVHVSLVERVPGIWELATETAPAAKYANEMWWEFDLKPGDQTAIRYTVTRKTGTRAK